jgi:hypothetical protein
MINIVVALRRNSAHLLQLLRDMMVDLSQEIQDALPLLPEEDHEDTRSKRVTTSFTSVRNEADRVGLM